jgi:hypothetical protein
MSLIIIGVYGSFIFVSGFRFKQIGLSLRNIFLGLFYGGILYIVFNIILLFSSENHTLHSSSINFLGFAIIICVIWEEFMYRAFLLPHFQIVFGKAGYIKSIVISIFITQIVFALHHIGNRVLIQHLDLQSILVDQFKLFVYGAILCMIYIISENLIYTVLVYLFRDLHIVMVGGSVISSKYLNVIYLLLGLGGAVIIYVISRQRIKLKLTPDRN